jgi:hypothetical protein
MTNNASMKSFGCIAALVLLCLFTYPLTAYATQIVIDNANFQTLPAGGLPMGCGSGCTYGYSAIVGWNGAGTGSDNAGQFDPGTQVGNYSLFDYMPDGGTVGASTFGPSLSQVVDTSVQVGTVYTLTVEIGTRNDFTSGGSADLLVNGVQYMAQGTMAPDGQWATFTATYIGLAVDMGDSITIQLNDTAPGVAVASFDDVALSETDPGSVPEPASIMTIGMGIFCLFLARRHKRLCR